MHMKTFFAEFKSFLFKGNIVDLAVAVVIGAAFGKIVTSVVNDFIMPLVGIMLGGIDLTSLMVSVGDADITYGNLLQAMVNFTVIALCVFLLLRAVQKLQKKKEEEEEQKEPEISEEVKLLQEIRDALQK